jgi:isopenicillin N synthase-like dioxygenase
MILYTPPQAAKLIPVINMRAAFSPDLGERKALAWEVHKACRDTGFLYLTGHQVPDWLIESQFGYAQRFFDLPLAEREAIYYQNVPSLSGWEGIGAQTLDRDSPGDLKESFYCGPDLSPAHPYVQEKLPKYGANQWPALPGFREQMLNYLDAVRDLGDHVLRLLALSLDLDEHYFEPYFRDPTATLRILKYPPHPPTAEFNQLGAGAHTDWGGVTLLLQDDSGGLEVMNASGEWISAPPLRGPDGERSYVVNLGDLFSRWTNGRYFSNLHRVLNHNAEGEARYSIPFFYSPDYKAVIDCLPSCHDAQSPPKFAPITAGEHIADMYRKTYTAAAT